MLKSEDYIYSVSEVNRLAHNRLQDIELWVEGEVCDLRLGYEEFGFFNLRDDQAILSCVVFGEVLRSISGVLVEGLSLLVRGTLGIYVKRGQFRLNVLEAEESGEGRLRREFLKLFNKLSEEGLFSDEVKKPLPGIPLHIGLITSPEGAAMRDVIVNIKRRFPPARVYLRGVRVQGEGAVEEIVGAIGFFNRIVPEIPVEVIILARGGGSLDDLHPFNTEEVARAIRASKLPVITGIGHEKDFTIADFASDFRASTPTGAAQKAVPLLEELLERIDETRKRLENALVRKLERVERELGHFLRLRVFQNPESILLDQLQAWEESNAQLREIWMRNLRRAEHQLQLLGLRLFNYSRENRELPLRINFYQERIKRAGEDLLLRAKQEEEKLGERLCASPGRLIDSLDGKWRMILAKLDSLSPLRVLSRGYAIVFPRDGGKPLRDVREARLGAEVDVQLFIGKMRCEIEAILNEESVTRTFPINKVD